jgi:hypothetical protein
VALTAGIPQRLGNGLLSRGRKESGHVTVPMMALPTGVCKAGACVCQKRIVGCPLGGGAGRLGLCAYDHDQPQ